MAVDTKDLVVNSLNLQRYDVRQDSKEMRGNQWFKKYTYNYQKNLNEILEKNFGPKMNEKLKLSKDAPPYNNKILGHLS